MNEAWALLRDHSVLLGWAAALSVVVAVASVFLVPYVVVRIPADYFSEPRRHESPMRRLHPAAYALVLVIKNLLGLVLLLAGIAMLALPGQGLLTMVIGLMLMDFPGKYRLERWLLSRPGILAAINWIRRRAGHPELEIPKADSSAN